MYALRILYICFLATIFLGYHAQAQEPTSTIKLHVFGASSIWWLAVSPQDDNSATTTVELKDGSSSSFVAMTNTNWGYSRYFVLTATSNTGFTAPLTVRLTSNSSAQITVQVSSIEPDAVIDTKTSYKVNTSAVVSSLPTPVPTSSPTSIPTSSPISTSTANPSSTNLCDVTATNVEPIKLLVPLYVYPGAAWDQLISAAASVKIIAIINPNSGPLSSVDSSYSTYMTKMANAGIEMVGYVHTSYGQRSLADVMADIDTWASSYPLVKGIFLDEAAYESSGIPYYTQVYSHVMSKAGYVHSILNPGQQPDIGYLAISSSMVVYENYAANLASTAFSSWLTCAPSVAAQAGYKYHFAAIAHSAPAGSQAQYLQSLVAKGMGLVYVTDGEGGCCTYNTLVSYFAQEASTVQSLN